jgi:hypothetical protein
MNRIVHGDDIQIQGLLFKLNSLLKRFDGTGHK